ncbi:MAG: hypothetical protein JF611_13300 [Betaproteobacteria bacterium]|jgi:hypothetical protein|nr:hypothetical protein [Betaproteobacteria bacterium]
MKARQVLDVCFELAMQLSLIGLCLTGALWMWPDGLLSAPVASIGVASILWAATSLALWLLGTAWLYFLAVPLFKRR